MYIWFVFCVYTVIYNIFIPKILLRRYIFPWIYSLYISKKQNTQWNLYLKLKLLISYHQQGSWDLSLLLRRRSLGFIKSVFLYASSLFWLCWNNGHKSKYITWFQTIPIAKELWFQQSTNSFSSCYTLRNLQDASPCNRHCFYFI